MNPGKKIDAYRIGENLRLGAALQSAAAVKTHFHYPDDERSFARATVRCVGVGKCRKEGGGTMCPSYRSRARRSTRRAAAPTCSSR